MSDCQLHYKDIDGNWHTFDTPHLELQPDDADFIIGDLKARLWKAEAELEEWQAKTMAARMRAAELEAERDALREEVERLKAKNGPDPYLQWTVSCPKCKGSGRMEMGGAEIGRMTMYCSKCQGSGRVDWRTALAALAGKEVGS